MGEVNMFKVLVKRPAGEIYVYETGFKSREEAEYAMTEAMLKHDQMHTAYIELESEGEYADNIQES